MLILRAKIVNALTTAGVSSILYSQFEVPKSYPAAVVVLESETGIRPTARSFTATDIAFTVYLVVNAVGVADPDYALYTLKELFRTAYKAQLGRDIPSVEYYPARADGARDVRIAKITLLKPDTGAAS